MSEIVVRLPTFHPGQVAAFKTVDQNTGKRARFLALRCGRRWGKTDFGKVLACDASTKGRKVGWFAPDYKIQTEAYHDIVDTLLPVIGTKNRMDGRISTVTGGRIDFWTLENERAGRSRNYDLVLIDEGAFTKPNAIDIWEKSIKPTLLDRAPKTRCVVMSNSNGTDPDNFFWRICNDAAYGFVEYHAPSRQNPYLPASELDDLKAKSHPLVFAQEYEAEFVDWSGVAFFEEDKLLVDGQPVEYPKICDAVFATIDSASKTGTANDGTAVTFWALAKNTGQKFPLTVLDWDILQIEGALLETWLPTVFQRLEALARECRARSGTLGAFVEDKNSGTILIQQAARRGWPAHAIDSKLTAMGKDERGLSVSGYVYQGLVKFSRHAYDKVVDYKRVSRNHLRSQVLSFRIGDKDAATRADDLLDTFTYGVAIALGDRGGF